MYIDCKPVESIAVTQPRAKIDTEGEIVLGTREPDGSTVPVSIFYDFNQISTVR